MVIAAPQGIDILAGKEALTEYRFHTRTAAHYFCSVCGIYTFHSRRSSPGQFVVNVACIDGVSPYDFESVDVSDGENHPGDGRSGGMAGTLVYRKKMP